MIYPSISIKTIEKVVNITRQYSKTSKTSEIRGILNFIKTSIQSLNDKGCDKVIEKSLIVYRNNRDLLTGEALEVINKLLGDRKLRKKILITNDGSYLSNRIWEHAYSGRIDIRPELLNHYIDIGMDDDEFFYNLSIKEQINWLYNHFDTIYLQLDMVTCRDDIIHCIERDKLSIDMLD